MKSKIFEVRDAGTFLPVIALHLDPHDEAERYLLARSGYGRTAEAQRQSNYVILLRANAEHTPANYNPEVWHDRTMTVAHKYIEKHFAMLASGAVVDVQYILHETVAPKLSESRDEDAYGYDHATGYFIQVFDPEDEDNLLVDEDSMFTCLNNGRLLTLLEKNHIVIPQIHLNKITLDLPV